jgi:hypothetical protein
VLWIGATLGLAFVLTVPGVVGKMSFLPEPATSTLVWTNDTGPVHPPTDYGGVVMAYDPADGCAILYVPVATVAHGGVDGGYTWSYCQNGWKNITGAVRPPLGAYTAMAYDSADHYLLLFGGAVFNGSGLVSRESNLTWKFANGTWSVVPISLAPPAREGESMAYDPGLGEIVLFGGLGASGNLADTWEYSHGKWTRIWVAHHPPTSDSFTEEPNLVWDGADHYLFLFSAGTRGVNGALNNATWSFSNGTWTRIVTTGHAPIRRLGASVAYDSGRSQVILLGGQIPSSRTMGWTNVTWGFSGGHWTRFYPLHSPAQSSYDAMCYDPKLGDVVLFIPYYTYPSDQGETWLLS